MNNHEMDNNNNNNNNNNKRRNSSNNEKEEITTNHRPEGISDETVPIPIFPQATTNHRPIVYNIDCLFSKQIPPSISPGQVQLQNTTNFPSSSLSSRSRETPLYNNSRQVFRINLNQSSNQQQHPLLVTTNIAFRHHSQVRQQLWLSEMDNKNKNDNKKRKNVSNNEEDDENNENPIPERKSETVPIPFRWATDHRATVHTLDYLFSKLIYSISGEVQCKSCKTPSMVYYHLPEEFVRVRKFICINQHKYGPVYKAYAWVNPNFPTCTHCRKGNSMKPVISDKKKKINWLFLFLGKMLGCCTLEQLKYFCKHTKNEQTGAKENLLYCTYLTLRKQLDPNRSY